MISETTQTANSTLKTNWVKQIYFYIVIGLALLFLCIGIFTFSKATLIKFIFPKADNSYIYGPYTSPELQCKNGQGSQYWLPKIAPVTTDPTKAYTPPQPTEAEIKDCIDITTKGIEEQKERTFQGDVLVGILMLIISIIVIAIHFSSRSFFLGKE